MITETWYGVGHDCGDGSFSVSVFQNEQDADVEAREQCSCEDKDNCEGGTYECSQTDTATVQYEIIDSRVVFHRLPSFNIG
jgi:hypothetical protein